MTCDKLGKRKLIVLVNGFPYGHREPYIETELPFLAEKFDEILLCALNVRTKPEPEIPECELDVERPFDLPNASVLTVTFASKAVYALGGLCCLWDDRFWSELRRLRKAGKLTKESLFALMKFISRARYEERRIRKHIHDTGFLEDAESVIVYSYRFDYQPFIGLLLKKVCPSAKVVARAHRRDLYEDRVRANYIPLRETFLEELDAIYCVSSHGQRYLQERFLEHSDKVHVSRLGTVDHGWTSGLPKAGRPLRIVSCSFLVPVKRVHLIAEALMDVNGVEIEWTHFGGGPEERRLEEMCRFLPSNVTVDFRGTVANDEILREYAARPFHLFINVSESEGVPVSIMEALSTGMPVIATDVGGTGEIVTEGVNGWLLPSDLSAHDLTGLLSLVAAMDEQSYQKLRLGARSQWEAKCCAEVNYEKFSSGLARFFGR